MNSCLVKYSKCKCMYVWVTVIFPSLVTLWEQHLHPTPCHQGQEQQPWFTRGSGQVKQSQAVLLVQRRRDHLYSWLLLVSWSLLTGHMWWPSACGVGLFLSWHSWEVGQSQTLIPAKGSQNHGSSALLIKLATVKSVILHLKTQTCCSWRILTQSFRGV